MHFIEGYLLKDSLLIPLFLLPSAVVCISVTGFRICSSASLLKDSVIRNIDAQSILGWKDIGDMGKG